jgi:hypothetical protein
MDTFYEVLKWLLVGIALSPIIIGLGWSIVEGSILPRLIPRAEITALANDFLRRYPDDPEYAAFIEEQAAWFRSQTFEQGKWYQVRKEIRRRLETP